MENTDISSGGVPIQGHRLSQEIDVGLKTATSNLIQCMESGDEGRNKCQKASVDVVNASVEVARSFTRSLDSVVCAIAILADKNLISQVSYNLCNGLDLM